MTNPVLVAIQDGQDFYDGNGEQITNIPEPFMKRFNAAYPGDHWYSLDAAEEARKLFLERYPQYSFAVDAEE